MQSENSISDLKKDSVLDIEKVIGLYRGYVYQVITNMVKYNLRDEDIEEMAADVFYLIWKNSGTLNDNMRLKPYITTITKNLVKNKFRSKSSDHNIEDYENMITDIISVEQMVEQNEENKIINKAIQGFDEESREIFIRYYYYSQKIKEISKSLEISESKVKVKLHRIRKQLKKILKERGYNYEK